MTTDSTRTRDEEEFEKLHEQVLLTRHYDADMWAYDPNHFEKLEHYGNNLYQAALAAERARSACLVEACELASRVLLQIQEEAAAFGALFALTEAIKQYRGEG